MQGNEHVQFYVWLEIGYADQIFFLFSYNRFWSSRCGRTGPQQKVENGGSLRPEFEELLLDLIHPVGPRCCKASSWIGQGLERHSFFTKSQDKSKWCASSLLELQRGHISSVLILEVWEIAVAIREAVGKQFQRNFQKRSLCLLWICNFQKAFHSRGERTSFSVSLVVVNNL